MDNETNFNGEPEPLTKQELQIMEEIKASAMKAEENFAKWQRDCGNRTPSSTMKIEGKIEGAVLIKLKYLQLVVGEGYRMLTTKEIASRILQFGIEMLYNQMMHSRMQAFIHSQIVTRLPEELRSAIITTEMRNAIKSYVKVMNEGGNMAELLDENNKKEPSVTKGICPLCQKPVVDLEQTIPYKEDICHADCVLNLYQKKPQSKKDSTEEIK